MFSKLFGKGEVDDDQAVDADESGAAAETPTEADLTVAAEPAIAKTPPAMTLAFDPHGKDVASWVSSARQSGHEMLMLLPMEPLIFRSSIRVPARCGRRWMPRTTSVVWNSCSAGCRGISAS
ncbi:MAG: hypothetical protein EXQ90_09280, partial [Rhodospirillales bacterium]|nr:hypothetical protein [Rhodospirillales bacterium]